MGDAVPGLIAGQLLNGRIDGIFFCPHGPEDGCDCRKPLPGLLTQIAEKFSIDLAGVAVIGDSLRDLQSAIAVDAKPILVRTGKGERSLKSLTEPSVDARLKSVPVFQNLAEAVEALLASDASRHE